MWIECVIVDSDNEIVEIDEEDNTMSVGIDVAMVGAWDGLTSPPESSDLISCYRSSCSTNCHIRICRQMNNSGYDEDLSTCSSTKKSMMMNTRMMKTRKMTGGNDCLSMGS